MKKKPKRPALKANRVKTGGNAQRAFSLKAHIAKTAEVEDVQLEGVDFLRVPAILINVGVHNEALYTRDDLERLPEAWNGRVIPVNHPFDDNGNPISANSAEVIEQSVIGIVLNTTYDHPKLKADLFIDIEKAEAKLPGLIANLRAGVATEISTGLFTKDEETTGEWEGEAFNVIARDHVPDHLAILTDEKGACSWEDGGGCPRNNQKKTKPKKVRLETLRRSVTGKTLAMLRTNELTHDALRGAVRQAIKEHVILAKEEWVWVEAMYADRCVYQIDSEVSGRAGLYMLGYSVGADDAVTLSPGPGVRVEPVLTYEPTKESITTNEEQMKTVKINKLITNANGVWTEADRETLEGMTDLQINALCPDEPADPAPVTTPAPVVNSAPAPVTTPAPTEPAAPAPLSFNQIMETADPATREAIAAGIRANEAHKAQLVEKIKANEANPYTDEYLAALTINELTDLATFAGVADVTPDYSGAVGNAPAINASDAPEEMPAMFGDEG